MRALVLVRFFSKKPKLPPKIPARPLPKKNLRLFFEKQTPPDLLKLRSILAKEKQLDVVWKEYLHFWNESNFWKCLDRNDFHSLLSILGNSSGTEKQTQFVLACMKRVGLSVGIKELNQAALTFKSIDLPTSLEFLRDMDQHYRVSPTHVTYNILLDNMVKMYKVDDAVGLFHHLRESKSPYARCNHFHYTTVIHGLSHQARFDEVQLLIEDMRDSGLDPNIHIYSTWIAGLRNMGLLDDILDIHDRVKQEGIKRNVFYYNRLVEIFEKDLFVVRELLEEMRADRIRPNRRTHSFLDTLGLDIQT